jgi:hypothetical protein
LQQTRRTQDTPDFKHRYQPRAGIEGTLSQGERIADLRRACDIGLAKTHLQHILIAAALNLRRIADWLRDVPRPDTRTAPFVRLAQGSSLMSPRSEFASGIETKTHPFDNRAGHLQPVDPAVTCLSVAV